MHAPDRYRFAHQFLLATNLVDHPTLAHWPTAAVKNDLFFMRHPDLNYVFASNDRFEIHLAGTILSTLAPLQCDRQVTQSLIDAATDWSDLEEGWKDVTGRWIAIVKHGSETRLYHDAAGLRSVFFVSNDDNSIFCASTPALLADLGITEVDRSLLAQLKHGTHKQRVHWPPFVVPYRATQQLMPNHYLDLGTGRSLRYWPNRRREGRTEAWVAARIFNTIHASLVALAHRQPVVLSLSGGYDSRVVMACAGSMMSSLIYRTHAYPGVPPHDLRLPRRITKSFGLRHHRDTGGFDVELTETLYKNVGEMAPRRDPRDYGLESARQLTAGGFVLVSGSPQMFKNFVGKKQAGQATVFQDDAERLAAGLRFERTDQQAQQSVATWLRRWPREFGYSVDEVAYWELRLGPWLYLMPTIREAVVHAVPVLNCRRLLELALSAPDASRHAPYSLARAVIERGEPRLLDFPFNYDPRDRAVKAANRFRRSVLGLRERVSKSWTARPLGAA